MKVKQIVAVSFRCYDGDCKQPLFTRTYDSRTDATQMLNGLYDAFVAAGYPPYTVNAEESDEECHIFIREHADFAFYLELLVLEDHEAEDVIALVDKVLAND